MPQVPMLHVNAVAANTQSGAPGPSPGTSGEVSGQDPSAGHDVRADGGFHTALKGVKKQSDGVKKPGSELKKQNDGRDTGPASTAGSMPTHPDTKTAPTALAGSISGAVVGKKSTDHGKFQPPFLPWTLPVEARAGHIGLVAGPDSAMTASGQGRLPPSLAALLRHPGANPGANPGAALGTGPTAIAGKEGDFLRKVFSALHKQDPPGTALDQTLLARLAVDPATTKALLGGGASPAQLMLAGAGPAVPQLPGATVIPAGLIIPQPVQHSGWSQALGERVQWMLGQNMQSAYIRLNPPGLGPLEVRILIQGDQTSVQFITHHTQVHDALEASLPRLRDMLGNQGMQLGNLNVNVSAHPFSGYTPSHGGAGQGQGGYGGGAHAGFNADDTASVLVGAVGLRQLGLSMLDVYA